MGNIEPLSEPGRNEYEYEGSIDIGGRQLSLYNDVLFSGSPGQLEVCRRHIEAGSVAEAESEFYLFGCKPPKSSEEQILRYRTECPGADALGKCAVRIVQYDSQGNEIS